MSRDLFEKIVGGVFLVGLVYALIVLTLCL